MRPFILSVSFVVLASAAWGRDDDPIREKLDKGKEQYQEAVEKAKGMAEKAFTKAEDAARAKADPKKLDGLAAARAVFEKCHELPEGEPFNDARAKLAQARKAVFDAHTDAIKAYQKAGQRAEAAAVVKALNTLQEGWDALQVGSVWTGQIRWTVQGAKKADIHAVTATVTDRQGPDVTVKLDWTAKGNAVIGGASVKNQFGHLSGVNRAGDGTVKGQVSGGHLTFTIDRRPPGQKPALGEVDVRLQNR